MHFEGDGARTLFPDPTNAAEVAKCIGARPVQVVDAGDVVPRDVAGWAEADYGLGVYCVDFAAFPADENIVVVTFEKEVYR